MAFLRLIITLAGAFDHVTIVQIIVLSIIEEWSILKLELSTCLQQNESQQLQFTLVGNLVCKILIMRIESIVMVTV